MCKQSIIGSRVGLLQEHAQAQGRAARRRRGGTDPGAPPTAKIINCHGDPPQIYLVRSPPQAYDCHTSVHNTHTCCRSGVRYPAPETTGHMLSPFIILYSPPIISKHCTLPPCRPFLKAKPPPPRTARQCTASAHIFWRLGSGPRI